MKLAIMQPYFLPYIGYFQLISAVDKFVIYDNIQFSKKGWINRNRILVNGKDEFITLPLKSDSDYLNVDDRRLADSFAEDGSKILRRVKEAYRKAPHFDATFVLLEDLMANKSSNLFQFIFNSVERVCSHLGIQTEFIVSSTIEMDHSLRGDERVLRTVTALKADTYINPIGGIELYSKEKFKSHHVNLMFIESNPIQYRQFNDDFVPWLSIIDVMMFSSKDEIRKMLGSYRTF